MEGQKLSWSCLMQTPLQAPLLLSRQVMGRSLTKRYRMQQRKLILVQHPIPCAPPSKDQYDLQGYDVDFDGRHGSAFLLLQLDSRFVPTPVVMPSHLTAFLHCDSTLLHSI